MRPIDEKVEIVSNIADKPSLDFKIDQSGSHIFEILRSKLYANPVESLIRELLVNARDSHIEAGRENIPITVWIPGEYMTIQDTGTGISPERMAEVYCYYGRSTKRDSNAQHGYYGIGGKSFFAYSDTGLITSIYDGVKREYVAFINESKVGEIKLLSETPTGDHNGLSVKIPVKPGDTNRFRLAIRQFTQFWTVPPKFIGDFRTVDPPVASIEGNDWVIYQNKELHGWNILYDGIPYRFSPSMGTAWPNAVTLKMKVGEIEVDATRENIRNTPFTRDAVQKKLDQYYNEIEEITREKAKQAKTVKELFKTIHSVALRQMRNSREWEWAGGKLRYPFTTSAIYCKESSWKGRLSKSHTQAVDENLIVDGSFILIDDNTDLSNLKGTDTRRIRTHMRNKGITKVYLVKDIHGIPSTETTPIKSIKLSWGGGGNKGPRAIKTHVRVRVKGEKKKKEYLVDNPSEVIYTTDLTRLQNYHQHLYYLNAPVVEITPSNLKLVKKHPDKWMTIEEYIQRKTKGYTQEQLKALQTHAKAYNEYSNWKFLKGEVSQEFKECLTSPTANSELLSLLNMLDNDGKFGTIQVPELFKQYPLLNLIDGWERDRHQKEIIDYVRMVNQTNLNKKEN